MSMIILSNIVLMYSSTSRGIVNVIIRIYTIFSATSTANTYECIHTLTGVAAADTASYSCSAVIGSHTEPSSNSAALSVLSKCKKICFRHRNDISKNQVLQRFQIFTIFLILITFNSSRSCGIGPDPSC